MKVRKAEAEEVLFHEGERSNLLSIVADGSITLSGSNSQATIGKGCLIGICEFDAVSMPFTYTAASPVTLYQYEYQSYDDLKALLHANQEACSLIAYYVAQNFRDQVDSYTQVLSSCQVLYETISEEYSQYQEICAQMNHEVKQLPGLEQLSDFNQKSEINDWLIEYYSTIGNYTPQKWKAFFEKDVEACMGFILKAGSDLKDLLSSIQALSVHLDMVCDLILSEYKIDLYTFYLELFEEAILKKIPYGPISTAIERIMSTVMESSPIDQEFAKERFIEYRNMIPKQEGGDSRVNAASAGIDAETAAKIKESLKDSLNTILNYAGADADEYKNFTNWIKQYIATSDRASSEDAVRILRKNITALFYEIYKKAFFKSLEDPSLPTELKMFFYFGYVDPTLSGSDNALYLYMLSEQITPDPEGSIFTFYDWLKEVYHNRKEPCVNEFNVDYTTYLHKMKIEKKINDNEEAAALKNGPKRVSYEFDNMFRSVNKMISGHITTFCPVFSDHELYKPLDQMLLNYRAIHDMINNVRTVDYSLFYREMTYTAPEIGIQKDLVQVEVLPDIILMPGAGTRGAMWQEITGRKRTSPARFALPFFLGEDLSKVIVRLCGEFRWELCRRIQGARWNDLGERSLTSDYCDYLETYKRSRDLTPEAKEKIKSSYSKYRNSSKEMFVHDYMDYVLFEGAGSLRLNKLVRPIIFTYCPFTKAIRDQVSTNQIYKEIVDKYRIKRSHVIHLSDLTMQKITKAGHEVPKPILDHRKFLEM